jgi:hypothetical protein
MLNKNGNVVTSVVRCSFPALFTPEVNTENPDKKTYSVTLLFPKDDATLAEIKKMAADAVQSKWPIKEKRPKIVSPFKDSQTPTPESGRVPAVDYKYGDCIYVRCTSKFQPGVVDSKFAPILDENAIYGGCWIRAEVNAFVYDNQKKGVGIGLLNVQFAKDGEAFMADRAAMAKNAFADASPIPDSDAFTEAAGAKEDSDTAFLN